MINTVEKIYSNEQSNTFRITYDNGQILYVPLKEANSDYQAIQEWAKIEGNNIIDNGA